MTGYKPIKYEPVVRQENIDKGLDPECYEVTSHKARTSNGYIMFNRQGFRRMHRYVYFNTYGEQPEVVWHKCGNRICINPAHLEGITAEEAIKRGPRVSQDYPPNSYCHPSSHPLSPEKVAEVRRLLATGMKRATVGRKLGISRHIVGAIDVGELYRDVGR